MARFMLSFHQLGTPRHPDPGHARVHGTNARTVVGEECDAGATAFPSVIGSYYCESARLVTSPTVRRADQLLPSTMCYVLWFLLLPTAIIQVFYIVVLQQCR